MAQAVGYREREESLRHAANRAYGGENLQALAAESVEELRALRRAQVDSALSHPGVQLVVQGDALGYIGMCGIDPQNLLQVDEGVLLHTRWLVACAGGALRAEFNAPVVFDQGKVTLRAVVGAADEVEVTIDGEPLEFVDARSEGAAEVRVDAPGVTLQAARADIEVEETVLTIRPVRN